MKTKSLYLALSLVAICMTAGPLFAQRTLTLRVNVPFNFVSEGKSFPAGEYEIYQLAAKSVVLRNMDTRSSVIENTVSEDIAPTASARNALVFHRIEGHYFLQRITMASPQVSQQLWESPMEVELAKASARRKFDVVSVLAHGSAAGGK